MEIRLPHKMVEYQVMDRHIKVRSASAVTLGMLWEALQPERVKQTAHGVDQLQLAQVSSDIHKE